MFFDLLAGVKNCLPGGMDSDGNFMRIYTYIYTYIINIYIYVYIYIGREPLRWEYYGRNMQKSHSEQVGQSAVFPCWRKLHELFSGDFPFSQMFCNRLQPQMQLF